MNTTVIVTGGAGFIGSNFILMMAKKHPDYRIICLDKLTYAGDLNNLGNIEEDEHYRFVKADICDRDTVYKLFDEEKPDIIVNFAAESHVDRSITDPEIFLKSNILGVSVLLDACAKYGIRRFHQVSTDEVYGDLPLDSSDSFNEESPLKPNSPYAVSKASADMLTLAYHRTYGVPVTISRSSNNYGPRQYPEKLIPLMIEKAMSDESLPIYGDGKNVRDWLYVEDNCAAIDLIIHHGKDGEIYNIGAGNYMTNNEIVRSICKYIGKSESLITYVDDRKGHDKKYSIDSAKIKSELGWKIENSFAESLYNTIKWYANK